jgi:predicted amidohydrolase YtcJ
LLDSCGIIALGTDFPVESTNPLNTFYSAVFRKDRNCKLKTPFFANQALTRMETLRGMTIWAAKSNFMETKIGSIEIGKLADFVVLNVDLMNASEKALRKAKVKSTFMQGVKCYTAEK